MKKQYITPEIEVIASEAASQLLATSLPVGGSSDNQWAPEFDFEDYEEEGY